MFTQNQQQNGLYNNVPLMAKTSLYANPPAYDTSAINPFLLDDMAMNGQQQPMMNQPAVPQYKKGGYIGLKDAARALKRQGRGGDTELAHINKHEAQMLKMMGGSGTINPKTGLREYKFKLSKILKPLARVGAAIVGGMTGGPAGAAAAAAAVGATQRSSKNRLKGALRGGLEGLAYSALAPMAGNALGVQAGGTMGKALMMDSPSLLYQLGLKGAPSMGGGLGFWGNGDSVGAVQKYMDGGLNSLMKAGSPIAGMGSGAGAQAAAASGEGPGLGGLLQLGLMGTALGGTLMRKEKPQKEESINEYKARTNTNVWGPEHAYVPARPKRYRVNPNYANYNPRRDPEMLAYEEIDEEGNPIRNYAQGGYINLQDGGYVLGEDDGQADSVNARVSDGEFMWKAPTVALIGGGNSLAGKRAMEDAEEMMWKAAKGKGYLPKGASFQKFLAKALMKA